MASLASSPSPEGSAPPRAAALARVFGRESGRGALSAWLRDRAARSDELFAVEESLLAGRFARYAARRLSVFTIARLWSAGLHVLELTWLASVFSAKPFIASLALQNATLVADAFFFGALEVLRRRLRDLGPTSAAAALTTRWLTVSSWLALVVVAVPLGRLAWEWATDRPEPSLFHVYALVCAVRLAVDLVLRTFYSGVFAHHRVYRPLWMPLASPAVLVGVTAALWGSIAGWAFPVGLAASVVVSRGLLFLFTRRSYRARRVPKPRWRLAPPRRREPLRRTLRTMGEALLAGLANTTTRLGGVVLLAAIVPSLVTSLPDAFYEEDEVAPFAFALHVVAPLLLLAAQWGLVFYHDWKRLEDDLAASLARHLHRRLLVTACVVGFGAWASASALALVWVPLEEARSTLLALLPGMLGLSTWTALSLQGFARGEFKTQAASAIAVLASVWLTVSSDALGAETWYAALAAGPWTAVFVHAVLARLRRSRAHGEIYAAPAWARALDGARGDVRVWRARAAVKPSLVSARVAAELGERGAIVRAGARLLWFERIERGERGDDGDDGDDEARARWLARAGGLLGDLEGARCRSRGTGRRAELAERGWLVLPEESAARDDLEATFAATFPEGFTLPVGAPPPPRYLALAPVVRQAIWRDAMRAARQVRSRSGWLVTALAPAGTPEVLFVAPRPVTSEAASSWYRALGRHALRVAP